MFQVGLTIIYTGLLTATIYMILKRSKHFLLLFMLLMSVSPNVQYLITDTTGVHFHDSTFKRMILEFFNVFLLVFYVFYNKIKINNFKNNRLLWIVLVLYVVLHIPNFILSYNITKSFILFMISVCGPTLLFLILSDTNQRHLLLTFKKDIYVFLLGFLSLGVVSITYYGLKYGGYNPLYMRTAGGMYMTNFSVALLSLFLPFVFLKDNNANRKTKVLQLLTNVGVLILLLASISRLGLLVYSLYFLFVKLRSLKSIVLSIFFISILIVLLFSKIEKYTDVNMVDAFQSRISSQDRSAVETTKEDERFRLYSLVFRTLKSTPSFLLYGVGIGCYRDLKNELIISDYDKTLFKYSNAHSLILNMLLERGLIIVFMFLSFLCLNLRKTKKIVHKLYEMKALKHGVILFIISSIFYMDLFVVSANHNALGAYFLFITLGFINQIKNNDKTAMK